MKPHEIRQLVAESTVDGKITEDTHDWLANRICIIGETIEAHKSRIKRLQKAQDEIAFYERAIAELTDEYHAIKDAIRGKEILWKEESYA